DGEDHDPDADKTAQQLSDDGVVVYTIGIGTAEGSPIIEPGAGTYKTDINGKTVISKLNEGELKNIALRTEGNYYHMENALATATKVANALDNMEKKLIESGGEKEYLSFSPFLIALAVLFLIIEIFTPETIKPKRKRILKVESFRV